LLARVSEVDQGGDDRLRSLVAQSLGHEVAPRAAARYEHTQAAERLRLSGHIPHSLDTRTLATPDASACFGIHEDPGSYPAPPILTLLARRRKTRARRGRNVAEL